MSLTLWHWSVSHIDHRQTSACCACNMSETFLLSLHWSLFFGQKYRKKIVQQWLQAIPFSPFSHLLHRQGSPTPAALAAGAHHSILPFPTQPYPLIPHIHTVQPVPLTTDVYRDDRCKFCCQKRGKWVYCDGKNPKKKIFGFKTLWNVI